MKKQNNSYQSILVVALAPELLLLVPLIAMQFTDEVKWDAIDFVIAGLLLFATGVSYALVTRSATNIIQQAAYAFALGATLFLIWANLAVGLIGSGPHAGNLMYVTVPVVGIIGAFRARFTMSGMERTMYAMAFAVMLLAAIALSTGMHRYPASSVIEILGVNGFFTVLFAVSGLLFRHAASGKVNSWQ